jgi:hypothetical protein
MRVLERLAAEGAESIGFPECWHLVSGVARPPLGVSCLVVHLGTLSCLALVTFASLACKRGHDRMVPVLHSNL